MMISSLMRSKADNIDPKMRGEEEDDSNWFSQWEEQLPSPDELMPLSQSLITPDLALAFDIPASDGDGDGDGDAHPLGPTSNPNPSSNPNSAASSSLLGPGPPHPPSSDLLDSSDLVGPAQDEPARTLKRPRLVWTPQLHKRFVDAVAHLGIKNAVPKTIMQLMSVEGLTRENVASHLQKYRLYLKRMQGLSGPGGPAGPVSPAEAADHRLFASAPVPHHFLQRGPPTPTDHFLPFVPVPQLQHHHHHPHHPQMAAAAQYYNSRQFGSPPGGQFDQGFYSRQVHHMMGPTPSTGNYGGEEEIGGGRKKVLTLFPTGED